jgi:hypothetical protein
MEANSVACMTYVYQGGQLMGILHMEHSVVVIQERDTSPYTWSWELNGEYIGKTVPPDMRPLRLSIVTPRGTCKGQGIWTLMPGERPYLARGPSSIVGSGKLQGPRAALRYLGFRKPKNKGDSK